MRLIAQLLACSTVLTGCLPYDAVERPAPPVPETEGVTVGGELTVEEPEELARGWWTAFGDPELDSLEGRMFEGSFQMHAAWARLEQARAAAELAGAPRWPTVSAEISAARQRQRFGTFGYQTYNTFSWSVPVSWELDLFDRIGAEATAAELDARATRFDVEATALSLTAQLAEAWFDLVELKQRRTLLEQQIETNGTFLELVQLRFQTGLASALDVYQQQQQVEATRARLVLLDQQERTAETRLSTLLGTTPGGLEVEPPDQLPELPPLPEGGVSLELMQQRPDLRSAQLRVSAADYRVGAAVADWFPRLSLRGSVGVNGDSPADLIPTSVDELLYSIAATVAQTIIDGGRRSAEIDRREGVVYERLANYGQTFVTALGEVTDALDLEDAQRRHIEVLERQQEIAENTLREARARYREGLSDFLNVLTALNSLHQNQLELLSARRLLISERIQLVRALGGSWTRQLVPPERLEPVELEEDSE